MYNFDEKRFIIRVDIPIVQVITLEKIKSGEIIRTSQDKNREQVLLLAIVCAIAMKIPLILIYHKESGDLRDSWVENVGDDTVYFVTTSTEYKYCKTIIV